MSPFQKRIGIILMGAVLSLSTAPNILAQTATPAASVAGQELEDAQQLREKGKYLEAHKIYAELLNRPHLNSREAHTLRGAYEDLNIQILLSGQDPDGTTTYEVLKGDSLFDLARKYQTTPALIKKMNHLKSETIYFGKKLKLPAGTFAIQVDRSANMLILLRDGKPLKHYRVATGKNGATPPGEFGIENKVENPTWYHAGTVIPHNKPENLLGSRWLGFNTPGFGIHGTTIPESIGKAASSGCIRMLNRDVDELYDLIPLKTKVMIKE